MSDRLLDTLVYTVDYSGNKSVKPIPYMCVAKDWKKLQTLTT